MLYAGIGHLSFRMQEFQAQVPTWLTTNEGFVDFVIIASGIVEISLGLLMVIGGKLKMKTGLALATFFVLIFPGNINQYVNDINAFGLDTDTKRMVRLFFQPVLVLWALWSTNGYMLLKKRK